MPASQHTVATERRRQQQHQTPDEPEHPITMEDPCEQAQLLSELEHLRAEVQSRNLKLVSLASVNKSMLNDRDKLKQVTDERDSFKA